MSGAGLSVLELSRRLGASIIGDVPVGTPVSLTLPKLATSSDISFAVPGSDEWQHSSALAIMATPENGSGRNGRCLLQVRDIRIACGRVVAWLPVRRGVSAMSGKLRFPVAESAHIAVQAIIEPGAIVGAHTHVEAGAVIGGQSVVGDYCRIGAGAVITGTTRLGNRVEIGAGTIVGEDGFAFIRDGTRWLRMPSFGGVQIKDDVVILARSVVHAGVFGMTVIEAGCVLDSQVLIGHDSRVGEGSAIAGLSALAGASVIGRGCVIGGQVGIAEGVCLADGVTVTGMSMVTRSLTEAGGRYSSGWPAEPSRAWWRRVGRLKRIVDASMPGDSER